MDVEITAKPKTPSKDKERQHELELEKVRHQQRMELLNRLAFLGLVSLVTVVSAGLFALTADPEIRKIAGGLLGAILAAGLGILAGKGLSGDEK